MTVVAESISAMFPYGLTGSVSRVVGLSASVADFPAPLGAECLIHGERTEPVAAEVVGFHERETILLPFGDLQGIRRGHRVSLHRSVPSVRVGDRLLGRIIDGRGRFLDRKPPAVLPHQVGIHRSPIPPLLRRRISQPLSTGVRVIDGLLTCGAGQRLGIFAGSGVGKSTLLGQMSRNSSADVNVVVLVGERGREVREFIEKDLGPEGLARSVVVVATSDEPALVRLRAAFVGTAIAEHFRDSGKNVLLMMDSVTRFALAQREIGLAAGEPPATRGYPPSVFALLPRLLERSGNGTHGSITGLYTVLVEADDANEPISDAVRGILDGHIMLSRKLAHQAHWPAIDVLQSISRSMPDVTTVEHRNACNVLKQMMSAYQQSEDLITIGAYQPGSNPDVDAAIALMEEIRKFLRQSPVESSDVKTATAALMAIAARRGSISTAGRFQQRTASGNVRGE